MRRKGNEEYESHINIMWIYIVKDQKEGVCGRWGKGQGSELEDWPLLLCSRAGSCPTISHRLFSRLLQFGPHILQRPSSNPESMPPAFILRNPMKPQSSTLLHTGENPNPSVWHLRPSTVGPTFPVISPTTPYHLPYDQVTPDNSSYPRHANHFNVNTFT